VPGGASGLHCLKPPSPGSDGCCGLQSPRLIRNRCAAPSEGTKTTLSYSWKSLVGCVFLVHALTAPSFAGESPARDLRASMGLLPGLIDSARDGPFVELVKAIDDLYPGRIEIGVYPMTRSLRELTLGKSDFHIPALRDPEIPVEDLPFGVADEVLGELAFVLYSNVRRPLNREDITKAISAGGKFPYRIEAIGESAYINVPMISGNQLELSLLRLQAGRIDALIHPQEEADAVIERNRMKQIHRALYSRNFDIVAIPKGPKGEEINRVLSGCIRELRSSGRLEILYGRIHRPYSDWQPAQRGW
jgi:polar amino acid transport system substrate-binding protein